RGRDGPGESAFAVDRFVGERVAAELAVPGVERLVAHIDHAVQVMGADHVGLGSDFDGISVLPAPMQDVTSLPLVVAALRARGYSDGDVRKLLGENFLRVLSAPRRPLPWRPQGCSGHRPPTCESGRAAGIRWRRTC